MSKQRQPRSEYLSNALSRLKPWEAEGISRRTWERRRVASVRGDASPAAVASVNLVASAAAPDGASVVGADQEGSLVAGGHLDPAEVPKDEPNTDGPIERFSANRSRDPDLPSTRGEKIDEEPARFLEPSGTVPETPPAWWREPLSDWAEGRLEIENIVTGKRTVIHFDGEAAKRRKRRQEPEPAGRMWFQD
ncbi:MAG: hypothetical protein ACR652_00775 [Methylocystis sp.]|uniref:hypothetical protein n=1 Tax=Methylocystis sp. TaxID=1911079 RepID=UPI003DA5D759